MLLSRFRVPLALKCQLLFGLAVVLLLGAALWVVSTRMDEMVQNAPKERAKSLADLWSSGQVRLVVRGGELSHSAEVTMRLVGREEFVDEANKDPFFADCMQRFSQVGQARDRSANIVSPDGSDTEKFRFARAVRRSELAQWEQEWLNTHYPVEGSDDPVERVLLIDQVGRHWAAARAVNHLTLLLAGVFAGMLAIALFWYLTSRIFLEPVRRLREATERVTQGDLEVTAELPTGDEFEVLAKAFNSMLSSIRQGRCKLEEANRTLNNRMGELTAKNHALDEANQLKGEFLANVSHELRTPLNSIIGFAELLESQLPSDGSPENVRHLRYSSNIKRSGRNLLDLINDLLDMTKIEAGRMDVSLTIFSVQDLIENLISLMRPMAEKKSVDFEVSAPASMPLIESDAGKIQQVLFNFLSNAVKFSPDNGTVEIKVGITTEQQESQKLAMLRVSVTDHGHGIAPDMQKKVFEKFTQIDPSVTRKHGGTGLGLHISKMLASLLGGEIELVSDVGRGAQFTLVLPLSVEEREAV